MVEKRYFSKIALERVLERNHYCDLLNHDEFNFFVEGVCAHDFVTHEVIESTARKVWNFTSSEYRKSASYICGDLVCALFSIFYET